MPQASDDRLRRGSRRVPAPPPPRPVSPEEVNAAADVILVPASLKPAATDELRRFEVLPAEYPIFDPAPGLYRTIAYLISRIA